MYIIFLDIDGVLNLDTIRKKSFNKECVKNLNFIIKETNAKIVIISTWRLSMSLEELRKYFIKEGILGEIIGCTDLPKNIDDFSSIVIAKPREREIGDYILENNSISNYVIIDDKTINLPNTIKTEFHKGLTKVLADKAINILKQHI